MVKKRLVVGNWKMYVENADDAHAFALLLRRKTRLLPGIDILIAPPYPFVADVAKVLESSPIRVGAQALSAHENGAHTGDVSAKMLKSAGALFSIIGHSERRAAGEDDKSVRAQLEHALAAGLTPVLCIGEQAREAGGEHFSVIEAQLGSVLKNISKNTLKKLVIAYEPVWAIGKSVDDAMRPGDLEEMVIFIRKALVDLLDRKMALAVPILYGGSVEGANAAALIKEGGVNGFLVGRASARVEDFLAIIEACK